MPRARPTPAQLRWQDREMGAFFHFGINTYLGQEWGDGGDPPSAFNPTALDCEQWVLSAKAAGLQYAILTVKHHDGFCLWPTKTTDYSVQHSPYRADVARQFVNACERHNMPYGFYLSPWDRHEPCYADPAAYDAFYLAQLMELLTGYGELFEIWFDGAGSQGRTYDWQRVMDAIDRLQPSAMVFNMGRPTIRWVGNEDGLAPESCWNRAEAARESMYTKDMAAWLPGTPEWVPAECDVPIRKERWFWHPGEEGRLRTLDELLDIHDRSVGHGANLLLNIAPDRRGLLPEEDVQLAIRWREALLKRYAHPAGEISGRGMELVLPIKEGLVDTVVLMEDILHGESVRAFALDVERGGRWQEIAKGTSIGHKKILRFSQVSASRMRLRITQAEFPPEIRRFTAYHACGE